MAEGLDALRSHGSDRNATDSEDDGGSGVHPSHGQLDMDKDDAVADSADDLRLQRGAGGPAGLSRPLECSLFLQNQGTTQNQ